jgi:hypothetical protein
MRISLLYYLPKYGEISMSALLIGLPWMAAVLPVGQTNARPFKGEASGFLE